MNTRTLIRVIKLLKMARYAIPIVLAVVAALSAGGVIAPTRGGKPGGDPIDDDPGPW